MVRIKHNSPLLLFFATSFIVLLTRVPFLLPGYGTDPDAWGVAYIARYISQANQYAVSRFPGYPLQELSYALIWQGGPLLMNGITAIMSGLAAGFFVLVGKKLASHALKDGVVFLGALIFAFTPVIYLNSVNSMDYVWAIAFILGGLYFALSDRAMLAGLFLGLAIGTRITSVAMLLPLILIFHNQGVLRKDVIKFILISFAVGSLFYIPAILTYGLGFFTYHPGEPIPLGRVLANATVGVWGWAGFGAIVIASSVLLWHLFFTKSSLPRLRRTAYWKIWLITIAIYLLIYFSLPHQSAYLIPLVPFTILLFQEFLTKKILLILFIAVICSSLMVEIYPGWQVHTAGFDQRFRNITTRVRFSRFNFFVAPFYGSLLYDHNVRADEINRFMDIFTFGNDLHEKSVILVGWNLSKFATMALNKKPETVIYKDFLDKASIQSFIERGYRIYYLPEILPTSIALYNVDFTEFGGTAIDIE